MLHNINVELVLFTSLDGFPYSSL